MIKFNTTQVVDIYEYLVKVSPYFVPTLDEIVDIKEYAEKIYEFAYRIEYFEEDKLCGFLGYYLNETENFSFITTLSVLPEFRSQGIAQKLMDNLVEKSLLNSKIQRIELEVSIQNLRAHAFYLRNDFKKVQQKLSTLILAKTL